MIILEFGGMIYLIICWAVSAIFLFLNGLVMGDSIRIEGVGTWLGYIALGPIGGMLSLPLLDLIGMSGFAVPLIAVAFLLSIPTIHAFLPSVLPDFQTSTFLTTLWLAILIGIAAAIAGCASGVTPYLIPGSEISPMPRV
jgi:hypothetical protein